jgi:hypothetical protein
MWRILVLTVTFVFGAALAQPAADEFVLKFQKPM